MSEKIKPNSVAEIPMSSRYLNLGVAAIECVCACIAGRTVEADRMQKDICDWVYTSDKEEPSSGQDRGDSGVG